MFPTIVSFYTQNTLYEKDALALKESCESWGLDYRIVGVPSFGKWYAHTCYKPIFLLQMMEELQRPILWLDADAKVVQWPILFKDFQADFSLRKLDHLPKGHPCWLYTGTIYLNYTPAALDLLKAWALKSKEALEQKIYTVDQQLLIDVFDEERLQFAPLPKGYAAIFEEEIPEEELFIVHYQASRLYRKIIDQEICCPFFNGLTIDEIRTFVPKID